MAIEPWREEPWAPFVRTYERGIRTRRSLPRGGQGSCVALQRFARWLYFRLQQLRQRSRILYFSLCTPAVSAGCQQAGQLSDQNSIHYAKLIDFCEGRSNPLVDLFQSGKKLVDRRVGGIGKMFWKYPA
jgi:hypothetical protein